MDLINQLNLTPDQLKILIFTAGTITGVMIANTIRKLIWNVLAITILSGILYGGISTGTFNEIKKTVLSYYDTLIEKSKEVKNELSEASEE